MPKHSLIWHNLDGTETPEQFDGNIFFTSDNHFFHEKMAKPRGFANASQMNDEMAAIWDGQVRPTDIVICHGDFFYGGADRKLTEQEIRDVLNKLPGRKYLIPGNHDFEIMGSGFLRAFFHGIWQNKDMSIDGQRVAMAHYPIRKAWNRAHKGAFHTYGHIHSPYHAIVFGSTEGRCMDVGVDSRPPTGLGWPDMLLWPWDEVFNHLSRKAIVV